MSRSGYSDDFGEDYPGQMELYRSAVTQAIKGKRGQAFLKEMLVALDALPHKRLIAHELIQDGEVCAIGAVGLLRGLDMTKLDVECPLQIGEAFGIAPAMVSEIEFENDEDFSHRETTDEQRWANVRKWVVEHLAAPTSEVSK